MSDVVLHPLLEPLGGLVGVWAGDGEGSYPSVEDFTYREELFVAHVGRPFLVATQRTWHPETGEPMHAETGYWRLPGPGRVELVVCQPTGLVEVHEGTLRDGHVELRSVAVAGTSTAKEVTSVQRTYDLAGDRLDYDLHMEAVGVPLGIHLRGRLRRAG